MLFKLMGLNNREILSVTQLRELIFENRLNGAALEGIRHYLDDNQKDYTLFEVHSICSSIIGSFQLMDMKKYLNKN